MVGNVNLLVVVFGMSIVFYDCVYKAYLLNCKSLANETQKLSYCDAIAKLLNSDF